MAKQNSTKHRGNPEWRARPDLPNYAEPRYHNTGFSQGSINLCWNDGIIFKKKKTIEDPRLYNSNSTSLLFLENIVTILKCTEHNLTKEVIFYKMTFKSSLFAALEVVREYCSTAHHSWFESFDGELKVTRLTQIYNLVWYEDFSAVQVTLFQE